MNQPKLKYPRLCRILTYVVVIGAGILPIILVFQFPVPDGVKVVVLLASLCGLLVYLFRNFLVLMMPYKPVFKHYAWIQAFLYTFIGRKFGWYTKTQHKTQHRTFS